MTLNELLERYYGSSNSPALAVVLILDGNSGQVSHVSETGLLKINFIFSFCLSKTNVIIRLYYRLNSTRAHLNLSYDLI